MPLLTTVIILQDQHLMLSVILLSVLSTILAVNGRNVTGNYVIGYAKFNHVNNNILVY